MKKLILILPLAINAYASDTVSYDTKKRLFCELTEISPKMSDFGKGDIRDGWLRIIDGAFYSIEIGGWVVSTYDDNHSSNVSDSKQSIFIKDYVGFAKLNKRTGAVKMNFSTPDMTQNFNWDCVIGPNDTNNREM